MTLSSTDAARLRNPHHDPGRLVVNAVPLTIVATAQINQSSFTYPISQLTVDTTSADWLTEAQVGRMVMIGTAPGLADVTWGIVRKTTTSNTLFIDAKQQADPGYARDIQVPLADNYYISIVKFRPAWGLMSSIRKGVFYRVWDTTYSDQGRRPRDIVNLGEHQQAWVSGGVARFTINVDVDYWTGNAYSSHSWGVDGQTTITSSASQLVVDCEPGCHEITYTLTNDRGKITTAYRYLFANDTTVYPPLNWQYSMDAVDCQQDRQGCELSLTFLEPLDSTVLFPGQLFLVTETPQWGNPRTGTYYTPADLDDPDGVADAFIGYASERSISTARGERSTTVKALSPVKMAAFVPIEKQIIIEKTAPKNWAAVTSVLSNPIGMFYYLSAWHAPYLIDGHDFTYDETIRGLRRRSFDLNRDVTLGGQLQQLQALLEGNGNIGSKANGTTRMLRNPNYFASSARSALSNQWTWGAGDIQGRLEKSLRYRPGVGKTYAGAFAYSGGSAIQAFRSLAPGYVRSQAGGETTLDDTTVTTAGGQARVNELAGFHHAQQNPESVPFNFETNGNLDVAEPCDIDRWHLLTLAASYDPMGEGWLSKRHLPLSVNRRWSGPRTARKSITIELEPETFGYPGIPLPINTGAAGAWVTNKIPAYFEPYQQKPPNLGISLDIMTAWNDFLFMGRSFTFGEPQTKWGAVRPYVVDARMNPHSAYFSDPADPIEFAVLTYDNDTSSLTLYSATFDVVEGSDPNALLEPITFDALEVWASVNPNDSFYFNARVLIDPVEVDYWIVGWKHQAGTRIARSTDGGATFSAAELIGSSLTDGVNALKPLGIDVYDERLIITANTGSTDVDGNYIYGVYTASTKGGAISAITNPTDYTVVPSALALRSTTSAIVPLMRREAPEPANPIEAVDFDGGYADYVVSGGGTTSGVATSAFFPTQNNMAFGSQGGPGLGNSVYCTVTIDLDAFYTFNSITFWRAYSIPWTLTGRAGTYTVTLLDSEGGAIVGKTFEETDFTAGSFTVTAADIGADSDDICWQVRVSIINTWTGATGGAGTALALLDDLDIDADLIEYSTDRHLYSLNPSTGAYTQRNSFQRLPYWTYGIAVDSNDANNVSAIVADENGNLPTLIQSTDGGATWERIRGVPGMVGLRVNDTTAILFGYNRLELSNDAGETSYTMLGDWAGRLGPIGLIRGVSGVLS